MNRLTALILFTALLPAMCGSALAAPDARVALVIGNSTYTHAPLSNPVNDARDMAAALRGCGFTVDTRLDCSRTEMKDAIRAFGDRIKGGGVGLFYYAGHGVQVKGENYLVPVGASVQREFEVDGECIKVSRVLGAMEYAGNRLNIVVLDACRDNPFKRSYRSTAQGLARMDAPAGSFLAYATAPGSVAADGDGRNGIYTASLLNHLKTPGLPIEEVFKRVRVDVVDGTGKVQIPWESSSLMGQFYFVASSGAVAVEQETSGPTGIEVQASVRGAKVLVDGEEKGTAPLELDLPPGEYRLQVRKPGYEDYGERVRVRPGRRLKVRAVMKSAVGSLHVTGSPEGAKVYVDGCYEGTLPCRLGMVQPGERAVKVVGEGYEQWQQTVRVAAGTAEEVRVALRAKAAAKAAPASSGEVTATGKKFTNSIGQEFVWIEPGSFMMGSPTSEEGHENDERQHRVTLSRGYYLQTTEVTQGQWRAVMGGNPSRFSSCGDDCPVEHVSWNDVQEFIGKLNMKEDAGRYRLPSEAEWEYACRAGSTGPFAFGNCLSTDEANYDGNYPLPGCSKGQYREKPVRVGSFRPNAWGLYDMHGNVWEWCQDWYGGYPTGSVTDPPGPSTGSTRVNRGGSWYDNDRGCRSANRDDYSPGNWFNIRLGFRLACSQVIR